MVVQLGRRGAEGAAGYVKKQPTDKMPASGRKQSGSMKKEE